jgi:hypothetical protein
MTLNPLLKTAAVAVSLAALGGCAALNTVSSDVSSYGTWPAGRAPGSYVFERLPSQVAQADEQAVLEDAARGALEHAGFKPAEDPAKADVTVQVGARISRSDRYPYDDPFWGGWRMGVGGGGYGRFGGWRGGGFGIGFGIPIDTLRYEREVAVLIRDRAAGTPLYESRAVTDGPTTGSNELLAAMYDAALKDFPTPAMSPRRVNVQMAP